MKRVVITGMGGLTPLGCSWEEIRPKLLGNGTGVTYATEYDEFSGLKTRVIGRVEDGELPQQYDRKRLRTMSRGAILSVRATEDALTDAGLLNDCELQSGRVGVAYGSCLGGSQMLMKLGGAWVNRSTKGIPASSYIQVLSHCCASSISLFYQLRGRMIPTCSACTSASQAIGYSFEAIRGGLQDVMVAGGAEEICVGLTGLFDAVGAASSRNEEPSETPRPFDVDRDGLVVSEGASTIVLEELEHARARGARIYAEVVGFGTNCDGTHMTNPEPPMMRRAMELALDCASLSPSQIDVVHAHATGTDLGDVAESQATAACLGVKVPVTATKGFQGHTLGATGAIETWFTIQMMHGGEFAPIKNLVTPDPRCAELNFVTGSPKKIDAEYAMVNNFAFGGVNTSLIYRREV